MTPTANGLDEARERIAARAERAEAEAKRNREAAKLPYSGAGALMHRSYLICAERDEVEAADLRLLLASEAALREKVLQMEAEKISALTRAYYY